MDFMKILREERARQRQSMRVGQDEEVPSSSGAAKGKEEVEVECALPVSLNIPWPIPRENELLDDNGEFIYLPDVVTVDEEEALWLSVQKQAGIGGWVQLKGRQSLMLGEHKDALGNHVAVKLPRWLETVSSQLPFFEDRTKVNHVLVNQYGEEDGSIAFHTDGPSYVDRVCILSLGGPVQLSFKERLRSSEIGVKEDKGVVYQVLMEPRSLLFFSGKTYSEMLHGIDPQEEIDDSLCLNKKLCKSEGYIKGERISLTLRHALVS